MAVLTLHLHVAQSHRADVAVAVHIGARVAVLTEHTRLIVHVLFDVLIKISRVRLLKLAVIVKRYIRSAAIDREEALILQAHASAR